MRNGIGFLPSGAVNGRVFGGDRDLVPEQPPGFALAIEAFLEFLTVSAQGAVDRGGAHR